MSLNSVPNFLIVASLGVLVVALLLYRRLRIDSWSMLAIILGLASIALAAGQLQVLWQRPIRLAVVYDVSPSCRGAGYLETDHRLMRTYALIDDKPARYFALADHLEPIAREATLETLRCSRTQFKPPEDVDAVVLFSDGQFSPLTSAVPVFPVIDASLATVRDSAVQSLAIDAGRVNATVRSFGKIKSQFSFDGDAPVELQEGMQTLSRDLAPAVDRPIIASITGKDRWPENDSLSIIPPPPAQTQRWLISASRAVQGWRTINPGDLPGDPRAYLQPSIIALDNLTIDQLPSRQQEMLGQYVRDLGGTLLIGGGDRAFGRGFYEASLLDALCPLASSPPKPLAHWIVLIDSSGSMSAAVGDTTRFALAAQAAHDVVAALRPDDVVSVGSFAERTSMWVSAKPARQAGAVQLPPAGAVPNGPTNLEQALRDLLSGPTDPLPRIVLILSDGEADFTAAPTLVQSIGSRRSSLSIHTLALSPGKALPTLQQIAAVSGGAVMSQLDPSQWSITARQLLRQARGSESLLHRAITFTPGPELSTMSPRSIDQANITWLREGATLLNRGDQPLMARWPVGLGRVIACGFAATSNELGSIAKVFASEAVDPRLAVSWDVSVSPRLTISAIDAGRFLNDLPLRLSIVGQPERRIPQVAPGKYELELERSGEPRLATVWLDRQRVDRRALAGRYEEEFDAIGVNRANLSELARTSGGKLIEPTSPIPIDFPPLYERYDATSSLVALGALLIAGGLVRRFW